MMRCLVVGLLTMVLLAPAVAREPDPEVACLLRDLRQPDEVEAFVAAAKALAKLGPDVRAARQEALLTLLAKGGAEVRMGPCTLNPGSGEPGCPPFVEY